MTRGRGIDVGAIARDLARDTEGFCRRYFPNGVKAGNYWQMGDVTGAAGRSLTIRLCAAGGNQPGKWTDHATGEFGDLLDLLAHQIGSGSFDALMAEARSFLGHAQFGPNRTRSSDKMRSFPNTNVRSGVKLFGYGTAIANTPAAAYLTARGITRFGTALRYHPSAYLRGDHGERLACPALLAAITDNEGQITGCSRIFLDPVTSQVAAITAPKRVLGALHGNGIRLGAWRSARDLIVGEGLENTLSVGTAFPTAALISCLTANHLAAFIWPSATRRIWIALDDDRAGWRGAKTLHARALAAGRDAFFLTPHRDDFNADLIADGPTVLRHRLAAVISAKVDGHDLWPRDQAA
ncbi:DUF7146 domain-containing protein [Litoreibacter roseus]|uniref:DNA primase n=1 Tax=Litoreibacter roseus TaxID=2601869 RepID=A0A6N6JLZ8_9RHOB|nr:toprim domain-containing protein [Litoreibacter roseus]GFE67105.1 DNA primase [Litoreibacter roseus]